MYTAYASTQKAAWRIRIEEIYYGGKWRHSEQQSGGNCGAGA